MIKKTIITGLLAATAVFGLTANTAVYADGASDVARYCSRCHGVSVNGVQVSGTAGSFKTCPQRSVSQWQDLISRMNGKGAGMPSANILAAAQFLASITAETTTTVLDTTTTTATTTTTTTTTTLPTTTTTLATTTTTAATTTTTVPMDTTTTTAGDTTTTTTAADTTTTLPTTTTTVATTTTTTAGPGCNTYVNGTTQYKYSGKGSCHGYADDRTGPHVLHDEKWCQHHKSHTNSAGNHTHAPVHPQCM